MCDVEKAARNDAYRRHRCVDCKSARQSAGRPRCNTCHEIYAIGGTPIATTPNDQEDAADRG